MLESLFLYLSKGESLLMPLFRKLDAELVSKRNNLKTIIYESGIEIRLYLDQVEKENIHLGAFKWVVEIGGGSFTVPLDVQKRSSSREEEINFYYFLEGVI
ncbi:hypothetical protein LGQ02_18050 [Bacillus shivajii]|uniref:hypothetical protein n=1 Tax=Bacillus shivajii TaxID=1983719 RepID=UPI001CFA60C1|nr:hypothetical protein [Bacillus shivajii]UCZ52688.1 hypothetical protein LGQ02_18050 [Bacillus shivajii]